MLISLRCHTELSEWSEGLTPEEMFTFCGEAAVPGCWSFNRPQNHRMIQSRIGSPIVAVRHAAKSLPEPGVSRRAAINVIIYIETSSTTHISAAICFGVFFFIKSVPLFKNGSFSTIIIQYANSYVQELIVTGV